MKRLAIFACPAVVLAAVLLTLSPWFNLPAVAVEQAPAAQQNTLSTAELAEGWILLFDGETLFGWDNGSQANWKVADGVISVSEGKKGLLSTTSEFGDYALRVDFRHRQATNSGVFLRTH